MLVDWVPLLHPALTVAPRMAVAVESSQDPGVVVVQSATCTRSMSSQRVGTFMSSSQRARTTDCGGSNCSSYWSCSPSPPSRTSQQTSQLKIPSDLSLIPRDMVQVNIRVIVIKAVRVCMWYRTCSSSFSGIQWSFVITNTVHIRYNVSPFLAKNFPCLCCTYWTWALSVYYCCLGVCLCALLAN